MKTAILYGSSLGNTQFVANKILNHFPDAYVSPVNEAHQLDLSAFDFVIFGTSTWGTGSMQDDFDMFRKSLLRQKLEGKIVAVFGLGDQNTYPDTFCDGMGTLYDLLVSIKARVIGSWPVDGYDFSESSAVRDGRFVGLALDEDNEPDLTDSRVDRWSNQLKTEFRQLF
jgi:flavodoxin I